MAAPWIAARPYAPKIGSRRLWAVIALGILCIGVTMVVYARISPVALDADARRATMQMEACMQVLKEMRLGLGIPIDPELDPARSGLIGTDYSDITTTLGDLRAKQTSLNPQFAGLLVAWLKMAGVHRGDPVALSFSGSFPALNLAAHCACDAMGLKPMIISSVGASCYGANIPGLTWLDMETRLFDAGLIRSRTRYASLGGIVDTGGGMDGSGIGVAEAVIARHGAVYLHEGTLHNVIGDVEHRMALYTAEGFPKAFINVGGNVTATGWVNAATLLDNGLLTHIPKCSSPRRGTIFRMFEKGVPVIHLINIERLAARYHLTIAPATFPPGNGLNSKATCQQHLWYLGLTLIAWFSLGVVFIFLKV